MKKKLTESSISEVSENKKLYKCDKYKYITAH